MARTEVSISNQALRSIGAMPIISFSDGNKSANVCRDQYPESRDFVLSSYDWSCAKKRVALAYLATDPVSEYEYHYQLPNDCLIVRELVESSATYRVEGDKLLTDDDEISIRYTKQETDPEIFHSQLARAIAMHLASEIAFYITGDRAVEDRAKANYELAWREATAVDKDADTEPQPDNTDWEDAGR